jgi:hypothetical protein
LWAGTRRATDAFDELARRIDNRVDRVGDCWRRKQRFIDLQTTSSTATHHTITLLCSKTTHKIIGVVHLSQEGAAAGAHRRLSDAGGRRIRLGDHIRLKTRHGRSLYVCATIQHSKVYKFKKYWSAMQTHYNIYNTSPTDWLRKKNCNSVLKNVFWWLSVSLNTFGFGILSCKDFCVCVGFFCELDTIDRICCKF